MGKDYPKNWSVLHWIGDFQAQIGDYAAAKESYKTSFELMEVPHYGDEDSEESMEEVAVDGTSQTEELYLRMEKAEKVMSTFESLNYRERAIVADHLGFCRDCYATHYYDQEDLDVDGKPKRKARRKVPFIELAVEHGLASPDTADKTYRRALEKMRKALSK